MIDPSLTSPPLTAPPTNDQPVQFEVVSCFYSYLDGLESEVLLGRFATEVEAQRFRLGLPKPTAAGLRIYVREAAVAPDEQDPSTFHLVHGYEVDISFADGEAILEKFHRAFAQEVLPPTSPVVKNLLKSPDRILLHIDDEPDVLPSDFRDPLESPPRAHSGGVSYVRAFSLEPLDLDEVKSLTQEVFRRLIRAAGDSSQSTSATETR